MGSENPNDLGAASFSCYLKPIEGVVDMLDTSDQKFSDMTVLDLHRLKPSMFTARTPSTASEASSWSNNQRALLQRSALSRAKPSGRAFRMRWFNACTGPCSTKKDVYVPDQSVKKGDQFTFPVLNEEKTEELPRLSIEVFGSGSINKSDIAKNLVRKMSILTWDAIPKSKETVVCDDMASEASSDLFEIEDITKTEWQPCPMSPTQYAPSEASIEWSVITASAAEFASVYSYDEKNTVYKTKTEPMKKPQKSTLVNGLLGCKSNNSVKVAEPVYRTANKSKI